MLDINLLTNPQQSCCCYINQTQQIQIARVQDVENRYIERAVFPEQSFCFDASPIAQLEIHTCAIPSAILSDRIPCQQLSPH